jgi:hypothetical protein
MSRKARRASKGKIQRLGEILAEFLIGNLEAGFPMRTLATGLSAATEREVQVEPPSGEHAGRVGELESENPIEGTSNEEVEFERYDETKFYFDLADVEYCVDVTITEIVKEKLVGEYSDPQEPPTLSEIFQVLLGEDDSLTKQVEEFEELIGGYNDHVHIDDLEQANNVMNEIVKELESRSKN